MNATRKEMKIDDAKWDEKFKALLEYKKKHGNCNVPSKYKSNPQLSHWVINQRRNHRNKNMSQDRVRKLEKIAFDWNPGTAVAQKNDEIWNEMFEELKAFKGKNGHCHVPRKYKQNPKLGRWVCEQRRNRRNKNMSRDRIRKLEEIAFDWNPGTAVAQKNDEIWNEMFEELKAFKGNNGHCDVPFRYKQNPKLGHWVGDQRQHHRKKKLSQDRIEKFEEVGFVWKAARGGAAVAAAKSQKNESTSLEATKNNANLPSTNEALALQLSDPASRKDAIDTNTKQIDTITHEQDAARGMLESIETETDSSGIATKDMEFLNMEALWDKLTANEALIVRVMSYLKKKELKPLFCSAKCFSFGNDNTWGILWKEKFCRNGICLWKEPPERADMTWREYYHHMVQYKINKSEEFLRNNAESYLESPRRLLDRFIRLELRRAEDSFNFKINYKSKDGATFLILAVLWGRLDVVKWLVEEKKCRINCSTDQEYSPLIYAAIEGNVEITEYLLRMGADCEHKASGTRLGRRCDLLELDTSQRDAEEWAQYKHHSYVALIIGYAKTKRQIERLQAENELLKRKFDEL